MSCGCMPKISQGQTAMAKATRKAMTGFQKEAKVYKKNTKITREDDSLQPRMLDEIACIVNIVVKLCHFVRLRTITRVV